MELEVIRFSSGTDSTNGILFEIIQQGNEIDGSSTSHTILRTDMPPKTSLVLEDNLSFDSSKYSLIITTSSVADITVIIK